MIWSLHPIQTQSVTYIVQRMNSLAAMFYLLSLLCYVQARSATPSRRKWLLFGASLLSGLFALGSKENAATLPFFILLYEWYFFRNLSRKWLKHRIPYLAGALLILTGLAYIYLGGQPLQAIQSGYLSRPFTMDERLLTEFRVVLFYISLLLFPHPSRLNLDHDIALSTSWLAPASTIPAVAAIGGLAVLAVCLARHRPLYSFCLLWFLGNLLIESSIIGLEISFEHRNYLPSMLAILPIVAITGQGLKSKGLQGAALLVAVAAMAFWTHERNKVWGDELSLWSDAAGKSPQKARPQNNLGTAMFHKGRYKEAIVSYSRTLEIEPEHAIAHNNLGFLLDEFGRIREAIHHYLQAIRIQPDYRQAHLNLNKTIKNLPGGNPERIEPVPSDPVESLLARGTIMADLDSPEEALAFFTQALAINP
ncbi:MAG: tetratricopeptide repeat protein, partial [Desulfobulbales bacterium]|nr:tetratricopeptide repeat protein [Desulfobulbales bacterium]